MPSLTETLQRAGLYMQLRTEIFLNDKSYLKAGN
jgi:hypothetical protein